MPLAARDWLRLAPHLRGTSTETLGPDLMAGLTVAALAVPQGLAYAMLAGLPVEMGLAAAALPAVIAALFGSSRHLVTGPTQPVALILGLSVVAPAVAADGVPPVETVRQIGLLAGVAMLAFGVLGFGSAARFLSDSVASGLIAGVGALIVIAQLPELAGARPEPRSPPALVPAVWPLLLDGARAVLALDPRSAALVLAVPGVTWALRRWDPRVPGALIAIGGAALVTWLLGWGSGAQALSTLAPSSLEPWVRLSLPGLPSLPETGPTALAIALLVMVQSAAAARALRSTGEPIPDVDREIVGQGAANLSAALVGALPTSPSFSRSALARAAGGRSRLAPLLSGVLVLAVLPLLGSALSFVPRAALAGLVILAGVELIDPRALRRACVTRGDAGVLVVTFGATLWLDVVQAIYIGVLLSLLLLIRRGGRLQMVELVRAGRDRLGEIAIDNKTGTTPAVVLHLEGDLNFAVAPELAERLSSIGSRGARVVILRVKRARHLDATVIEAVRRVAEELARSDVRVILCGLTDPIAATLERTELAAVLGPSGLLRTGSRLMEGYERAIASARARLAPLSDDEIFRSEPVGEAPYEAEVRAPPRIR